MYVCQCMCACVCMNKRGGCKAGGMCTCACKNVCVLACACEGTYVSLCVSVCVCVGAHKQGPEGGTLMEKSKQPRASLKPLDINP